MKIHGLVIGSWFFAAAACSAANPFESESTVSFAAPATVEEPLVEIRGEEWRGLYCGVRQSEELSFRDAESWKTFWETNIQPFQKKSIPTPDIDFTKEMVLAVFRGEKPNPSYDVEILKIETSDESLNVQYRNRNRLVGISSPRIAVQPFHLKKNRGLPRPCAL